MTGQPQFISRRRVMGLIAATVTTFTSGCSDVLRSPPPVGQVNVSVVDLRRPDAGLATATLPLVIELHNEADRPIPDPSLDFDLVIQGEPVASVQSAISTIDPGESVTQSIEAIVEYGDVGESVVEAIRSGSISIALRGEINSGDASDTFEARLQKTF